MSASAEYTILSERTGSMALPATGCLMELEDVLVQSCDAQLCCPPRIPKQGIRGRIRHALSPYEVVLPKRRTRAPQILLLTGLSFNVIRALHGIPGWRRRYDLVCAYVMDAHVGYRKPRQLRPGGRTEKLFSSLDHVFIPLSSNLQDFPSYYGLKASLMPYACDVLKWGSGRTQRCIDVNGYGRQNWEHSRLLARTFNRPDSSRIYHHTDYLSRIVVRDQREQRALFWKTLRRSKIALAYDPKGTTPARFRFSILAQRWMECATAGCLIVGSRPACPEADECLDWTDAAIDLPHTGDAFLQAIEALLKDNDRLLAAHKRNHLQTLRRHDWRHRLAQMLNILGLPYPDGLNRGLDELARRAQSIDDADLETQTGGCRAPAQPHGDQGT